MSALRICACGRASRRAAEAHLDVAGKISDQADVIEAGTGAPNHCGLGGWAHSRQHSDQFV
jgi:hypothetical protein